MRNKVLILVRGLPGSGKSTTAQKVYRDYVHFETDEYFMQDGKYRFKSYELGKAHAWCQWLVATAMRNGANITVSNTFTQMWEMAVYHMLAQAYEYEVEVLDLYDCGLTDMQLAQRNKHGVPVEKIQEMRARWEK